MFKTIISPASDNGAFDVWHQESYLKRYPSPPRAWAAFTAEDAEQAGFHLTGHEVLRNTISFSLDGLIDYFTTQSNIIAAVEEGDESITETRAWLKENLECFFEGGAIHDFLFNAPIWYLQRSE